MKQFFIKAFNFIYLKTLAKKKFRKHYNDFLYFFLWKICFAFSCLLPVKKNMIFFACVFDKEIPGDFRSLYEKAKKQGFDCVCLFKPRSDSRVVFLNEWRKLRNDLKFQRLYARAAVTFLNEYYLPAYANKPRKSARLVQLWHGCGAFKKFSYSVRDSSWGLESDLFDKYHVHKTYTDIFASSEYIVPIYNEAFCAEEGVVKPLGNARTDVYFKSDFVKEQRKILQKLIPEAKSKKVILWAPTLRGDDATHAFTKVNIDLAEMKKELGKEYIFLIKFHPRVKSRPDFSKNENDNLSSFVFDVTEKLNIETALCASDIVVTDYSSLIFEYSLLNRPMVFFADDLDSYENQRSFYFPYDELVPGKIAKTSDELIAYLKTAESDFDKDRLVKFKEKFMSACDGNSTERILKEVTKDLGK